MLTQVLTGLLSLMRRKSGFRKSFPIRSIFIGSLFGWLTSYASASLESKTEALQPKHWSDQSQQYISNRADELARWVDSFFHSDNFETETADSFLRLRTSYLWLEERNNTTDIGLRGKVTLPALEERISLIFFDNEDPDQELQQVDLINNNESRTDVSLQFTERDKGHHRVDYRVGIRSSGAFKSSARYRYKLAYDNHSLQFSNKLRYRADEGFENIMRYRHDDALSNSRLLQYFARVNYGEVTNGVEWSFTTTLTKQLAQEQAFSYFGQISGITRPSFLTTKYGAGLNYRATTGKPYLIWEIRPALYWIRPSEAFERNLEWRLLARIEILFD